MKESFKPRDKLEATVVRVNSQSKATEEDRNDHRQLELPLHNEVRA